MRFRAFRVWLTHFYYVKKTVDRAFRLGFRSTLDDKNTEALTLAVSLPSTYPKTLPRLSLSFNIGLSTQTRQAAEQVLRDNPKNLLGTEMIFELATALQDILDQTAKPVAIEHSISEVDRDQIPNLHQERALHEEALSQRAKQVAEEKQLTQKEVEDEEHRMIAHMLEQEKIRMANRQNKQSAPADPFKVEEPVPGGLQFDQPITIKNANGIPTTFHTVHQRVDFREGPITKIFTVHPWGTRVGSAPYLVLKECYVTVLEDEDATKKQIQDIESSLDVLKHLPPHAHIVKPLNFNIERSPLNEESLSVGWDISILSNLAEKGSVIELLDIIGILNIEVTRAWALQLLEGLDFYHQNGIVHAKVHLGNILLEVAETGNTIVKLSDGGYQHSLHSIKNHTSWNYSGAESVHWSAPEVINSPQTKPIAATDIWDLGVALLQMIFGVTIQKYNASPKAVLASRDISRSLDDFFEQTFVSDYKKRKSAFDLKLFEFLRTEDPVFREPTTPRLTSEKTLHRLSTSLTIHPRRDSLAKPLNTSRYLNDFDEIGRLGRGGFGEVVKARHKLENRIYAIKKITQNSASALSNVLSEIVMLSLLNHPNVVRYFTAWTENDGSLRQGSALSSSSSRSSLSLTNGDPDGLFTKSSGGLDFIGGDHPEIIFGYSDEEGGPDSQVILDGEDGVEGDDSMDETDQGSDEETEDDADEDVDAAMARPRRRKPSSHEAEANTILYIQMQYCERQAGSIFATFIRC